MNKLAVLPLLILVTWVSACEVGESVPTERDDLEEDEKNQPTDDFVTLTATAPGATSLMTEIRIPIAVTVRDNQAVNLSVTAPEGLVATMEPSVVTGNGSAELVVEVASDAEAKIHDIKVSGVSGTHTATWPTRLEVKPQLILQIKSTTGGDEHPYMGLIKVRSGTTFEVINNGTMGHNVHGQGATQDANGQNVDVQHGNGLAVGQTYSQVLRGVSKQASFYCHDHGTGTGVVTTMVVE